MTALAAVGVFLLLLYAFCGQTILVTIAAKHTLRAAARRWHGRRAS